MVIPHSARSFWRPGVVVHRSIALEREPGVGDPPRTSNERSIVDTGSWSYSDGRCRAAILAAIQQRLTTPKRLRAHVADTGPIPRIHVIRESIVDAEGGIDSLPERAFADLVRDHGLPEPRRQARVRGTGGTYYLDADFGQWRVAVEVDGAHHRNVQQSEGDLRRQNELVIGGRTMLRFSSFQIRHEPASVANVLRKALIAAGWSP